uniref:Cadherin domain-containing protein n=1 Tax=Lutzomyia longipalpis TaxID=7200 RepID=A0A1B0CA02_LUTLO
MAIKATDRDEGRNGYIEYLLTSEPTIPFTLGTVDGLLRVSGRLDREIQSSYNLMVTARDRGDPPKSTQTNISVKILDENDNSPVFDPKQYSASIAENASIGAMVLQGASKAITYRYKPRNIAELKACEACTDMAIDSFTPEVLDRVVRDVFLRAEECWQQEQCLDRTGRLTRHDEQKPGGAKPAPPRSLSSIIVRIRSSCVGRMTPGSPRQDLRKHHHSIPLEAKKANVSHADTAGAMYTNHVT